MADASRIPIKERLEYGLSAAFEAEKIILSHYQDSKLKVETKADKTIVTQADRLAEQRLRDLIERIFPEDSIIGEELAKKEGSSGYAWILDPIDGTQSFVCGVPLFGTLIGLTYNGDPIAGIVNMPALKEVYYASKGEGAWWRPPGHLAPLRAQVSTVSKLNESVFCTTSHSGFDRVGRRDLFDRLLDSTKKFRGWGSCYGHMLVATGRADLVVEPDLSLWDCAALYPIVTEAGGEFFDLSGTARIDGGSGISVNSALADSVRKLVAT